jgi:NAD(P)-dependent dehydrogenase (short-subunit alcohol dehydrogenase family)
MIYNPFSLQSKTILVTGASSGIGRATAIECSKMGAKLIITARNEERLNQTLTQLEGDGHIQILADLTIMEDINRLVDLVPQLDGVVNNAGINKTRPIPFIIKDDLEYMLKTNTLAPVLLTKSLYKKKKVNKNASIVFTSSIGGISCFTPGNSMYGMSKSALHAFIKFAAIEFAPRGIRCNSVNPGMVETPLINRSSFTNDDRETDIARYPLKRYGNPQEIAWGVIYLLSDATLWITGINLTIDGGRAL